MTYFDVLGDLNAAISKIEQEVQVSPPKGHSTRSCSHTVLDGVKVLFEDKIPRSDSTALREATTKAIDEWHSLSLADFEAQLQKLRDVIVAMQPRIATLRAELTRYTALFKVHYVPLGEDLAGGPSSPHITLARKILRAGRTEVLEHMKLIESKMYDRLSDKYTESFGDIQKKVMQMRASAGKTKLERGEWLMCVIACCGCRKGEPLWPEIEFMPYSEQEHGNSPWAKELAQAVDPKWVIVQRGVLKDKSQFVRRYHAEQETPPPRIVVKPTLFLPAAEVCALIQKLRANFPAARTYKERDHDFHNLFQVVQKYFPEAAQKAAQKNWTLSTHYLRKLYSVASFQRYGSCVAATTGRTMDRCVWSSMVLGHDGAVSVTLRYMNVDVTTTRRNKKLKV